MAQAQDERGIIIVFTGNGKGKPPRHLVRQHAQLVTEKVGVVQFIKGTWPNGERKLLEPHGVEFQVMATGFTWIHKIANLIPRPAVKSGNMPNECWQILHWIWFCSMN